MVYLITLIQHCAGLNLKAIEEYFVNGKSCVLTGSIKNLHYWLLNQKSSYIYTTISINPYHRQSQIQ